MKKVFILFYICTATVLKAQVPNFVVKDSRTNKPIQFVAITSQKGSGTYTDESGEFNFPFSKNDTILTLHLSYNSVKISYIDLLKLPNNTVLLPTKEVSLREAVVKPAIDKLSLLGYYNEKTFFKRVGPSGQNDFSVYVNHIKNVSGIEGYLNRLYFDLYVDIFEKSNSSVRIRVFSVGADGLPKDDLLTKEIIKRVDRITPNIKIDVSEYNIVFPSEGVFIGLEFFCNFDVKSTKNGRYTKNITDCPHIPTAKVSNNATVGESYYWTVLKGKIQWVCYSDGKIYRGTEGHVFKFGAEVRQ